MGSKRRLVDAGSTGGATAVILVAAGARDVDALSAACRRALRETDAVLARRDGGVTSVLLRNLRDGPADTPVVVERIRAQCAGLVTDELRIGVAVGDGSAEPLDQLVRRAEADLSGRLSNPTDSADP